MRGHRILIPSIVVYIHHVVNTTYILLLRGAVFHAQGQIYLPQHLSVPVVMPISKKLSSPSSLDASKVGAESNVVCV